MLKLTYNDVKTQIWDIVKDNPGFVYKQSEDCEACLERLDWENDSDARDFTEEPPHCSAHFDEESCRYFYADANGKDIPSAPACIVGNWFVREGLEPEDFGVSVWDELEGKGVNSLLPGIEQIRIETKACELLMNMQSLQDTGSTWLDSYSRATARMEGAGSV